MASPPHIVKVIQFQLTIMCLKSLSIAGNLRNCKQMMSPSLSRFTKFLNDQDDLSTCQLIWSLNNNHDITIKKDFIEFFLSLRASPSFYAPFYIVIYFCLRGLMILFLLLNFYRDCCGTFSRVANVYLAKELKVLCHTLFAGTWAKKVLLRAKNNIREFNGIFYEISIDSQIKCFRLQIAPEKENSN